MSILLTGASGYLGQHVLLALLSAGHRVTALVRDPTRLGALAEHANVRVHRGDLNDEQCLEAAVQGIQAVLHAALVWGAPRTELDLPDTIAAAKLFDAAGRAGVRRCVLVSSTAVHRPFSPVMTESDALQTTDLYGASKAAAELMMWAACHSYGMTGIVARSALIVGPAAVPDGPVRSDRTLEGLVLSARADAPLSVVEGAGRQLISAPELAGALCALVNHPKAHGTYLCADAAVTLWSHIAAQVVQLTDSSSRIEVTAATSSTPSPRFDVGRFTALLGRPADSATALTAHIRHLAQQG